MAIIVKMLAEFEISSSACLADSHCAQEEGHVVVEELRHCQVPDQHGVGTCRASRRSHVKDITLLCVIQTVVPTSQ